MNATGRRPGSSGSVWMRTPWQAAKAACLVFVIAAMAAMCPLTSQASDDADSQASREEVLGAMKVDELDADYVILVDTSGSMEDGQLYDLVKSALSPLLRSLSPRDHVSLLTFDTVPAVRYSGAAGTPGDSALAQLPDRAMGTATDIGAAVEAGIRELERSDALDIGTLILLTDGQHEPAAGSAYPGTSGDTWNKLAGRGKALGEKHEINSYALALSKETDASLLQMAFSQTIVAALPQDQVASYFGGLRDQVKLLKARAMLANDRPEVTGEWSGSLERLSFDQGSAKATLVVRSPTAYVPLVLSNIRVSGIGTPIQVGDLPDRVEIMPKTSTKIPVQLSFDHSPGFHIGHQQVTDRGSMVVSGTVSSPWSDVLTKDLDLPFEPALNIASTPVAVTGEFGLGYLELLLYLAGLLIVVMVMRSLVVARQSRLRGAISVLDAGVPVEAEVRLRGRRLRFGKGPLLPFKAIVRGSVRAVRRRSELDRRLEYGVRIKAHAGAARRSATLWGGDQLNVDQVQISYHD